MLAWLTSKQGQVVDALYSGKHVAAYLHAMSPSDRPSVFSHLTTEWPTWITQHWWRAPFQPCQSTVLNDPSTLSVNSRS